MKKAIALLVAAMLLTGLSACGGSTTADAPAKSDGTSKTETNKEEPKPQPADLTGTWKQTNSNDPSSYMEATISGDTIEVNWIGTDTKSLYWKGTYQAPAAAGDWKWTSQGDTETMASALLASQDATKDFTYSEADGVSWETTALGTTITVKCGDPSWPNMNHDNEPAQVYTVNVKVKSDDKPVTPANTKVLVLSLIHI